MSYIGSTPTTQSFIAGTDYFNGNGSTTAFTLSRPVVSVNDIQAVVNNVVQVPNDAYNVSGSTITFTSAPSSGTGNVYVRYMSTTTQSITPSQNTVSYATLNTDLQSGGYASNFKNRLINGAMVIDQRNAGASVTPTTIGAPQYTLDRWNANNSAASKYSVQRNAGSVTPPVGFTNYLGVTSLAATTVASGDYYQIIQQIEGFNTSDLAWGTANASTVTLSFWVRSSLTGTFGGALTNGDETRSYPFSFTINSANTWEYETITIAGDTTGNWYKDQNKGITLRFSLGMGSTYSGTAGAWAGTLYASSTGATSVVSTNGATFYITGVQLEKGSTATSFDYRPYGTELALCQRYFYALAVGTDKSIGVGSYTSSTRIDAFVFFKQSMRANPTLVQASGTDYYNFYSGASDGFNDFAVDAINTENANLINNTNVSGTSGRGGWAVTQNASAFVGFNAEL